MPNPLDLSSYVFRKRSPARPALVWLRAFHETYNPSLAVRVLHRLSASFPEARLIMVGPDRGDGARQRAEQAAREHGIADRVEFVGGVAKSEVPRWLEIGRAHV